MAKRDDEFYKSSKQEESSSSRQLVLCAVRSWNLVRRIIPGGWTTLLLVKTDSPFIAGLPSLKGVVVTEFLVEM
jgi:hypothetical protein